MEARDILIVLLMAFLGAWLVWVLIFVARKLLGQRADRNDPQL